MFQIKSRRAATMVEIGIGMGLLSLILVLAWTLLNHLGSRFVRVSRTSAAMTSAELALAHVQDDLSAMLPPDPRRPETMLRLDAGGRRLSFFRLEPRGDRLIAQPVSYEARPTTAGHGHFELYRNGRKLPQVLLARFDVKLVRPAIGGGSDAGLTGSSDLEVSNPVVRLRLTGVARDCPARELAAAERHVLPASMPLPATTPAAMAELPAAARGLLERAVRVSGSL